MTVSLIGNPSQLQNTTLQSNTISQEEFLKVMLTQLRFQDPLKPIDNQEFLAQMAQFSALEQTRQLNERIDMLLNIQSSTQSIGLIGKSVEVATGSGSILGQVTTLTFRDGTPMLTVRTTTGEYLTDVSLAQISVVR